MYTVALYTDDLHQLAVHDESYAGDEEVGTELQDGHDESSNVPANTVNACVSVPWFHPFAHVVFQPKASSRNCAHRKHSFFCAWLHSSKTVAALRSVRKVLHSIGRA